jgi:hypothetical protein
MSTYDAWKLSSDPEYGDAPDDEEAWCDQCDRKTGDVRVWFGELLCEKCIADDKLKGGS